MFGSDDGGGCRNEFVPAEYEGCPNDFAQEPQAAACMSLEAHHGVAAGAKEQGAAEYREGRSCQVERERENEGTEELHGRQLFEAAGWLTVVVGVTLGLRYRMVANRAATGKNFTYSDRRILVAVG